MPFGPEQRKLAAIMFTDMVGYSALVQKNEALALKLLEEHKQLLRPLFPQFGGQEVKTIGDAFLVEFASALEAARCAIAIQKKLREYNASSPETINIQIRIGIHVGDVVYRENDVFGDGVNIAARIEPLAEPGGICLTQQVFDQVHNKLGEPLVKLGQGDLKNIQSPVAIYKVVLPWQDKPSLLLARARFALRSKRTRVALTLLALALGGLSLWQAAKWTTLNNSKHDPQAQELCDRADFHLNKGGLTNIATAIDFLQQATRLDPTLAVAYSRLAKAYNKMDINFEPHQGWDAKAFESVQKALGLDPSLADAYTVRGECYFTPLQNWDAAKAIADHRHALKLNPNLEDAYVNLAFVYFHRGLLDEALAAVDRALAMKPGHNLTRLIQAQTLMYLGNYKDGLRKFEGIPPEAYGQPRHRGAFYGLCLFYSGQTNEASALLDPLLQQFPDEPLMTSLQAILLAKAGALGQAQAKIKIAQAGERSLVHSHHIVYQIAAAYALLKQNEQALDWLKRAAEDGFPCYPYFENDPNLANLRNDQEFVSFMAGQKAAWQKLKNSLVE